MFVSVGLDVQSEYLFKGLELLFSRGESIAHLIEVPATKKMVKKQTTITDIFKERKRKFSDLDISQSKEKKKRDTAVIEKFRYLKESFGKSSTELREDEKSVEISNKLLQDMTPSNKQGTTINQENNLQLAYEANNDCGTVVSEYEYPEMIAEDLYNKQDFIADEHFDNILSEIENEISKSHHTDGPANSQKQATPLETTPLINNPNSFGKPNYKLLNKKRPTKSARCNYSFIEKLQKNENLIDEDDTSSKDGGFSDTIKSHVEKFIMNTSINTTNTVDPIMTELIRNQSFSKLPDKQGNNMESCIEDLKLQNNKAIDINTTIVLKTPKDLTMVPEELAILKEHDVDMTTENPEVIFGTRSSNKDISHLAIKGAKNENYLIQEKANLINHSNNFKNIAGNIKPEMFVDHVNIKREPTYFSQELLTGPCDMKKLDNRHHKIVRRSPQNNNLKITIVLQPEQYGKFEESEDEREKYIPEANLPSVISSDKKFKQMCANNCYKFSKSLMLGNFHTMSMNTSQVNTSNTVDKQVSISKRNRLENQPILYYNKRVDGLKPFNETKPSTQPLPYNTTKQVNTNILPSKTKDENWNNLKLNDDTIKSVISTEASASLSPFTLKKEKYVNRYSFSTTKIDVQTKKQADLQVQIIRKLKVDLDVTEILTREDIDVQTETAQTSNYVDDNFLCALEVPNYTRKSETSDKHEEDGQCSQLAYELDPNDKMCVQEKNVPKITQNLIQSINEKELLQEQTLEKPKKTEDLKGRLGNIFKKYKKILR